jgi:hypothetical protein
MPISTIGQNGLNAPLSLTSPTIATPTFTGQATIPTINLTSGQIVFPATANISSNANTLDDYEEGSWDCRPSTSSSSVTPLSGWTLGNYSGWYTKIGSLVTLSFYFSWSNTTSNSGLVYLIVPFPVTTGSSEMWCSTAIETSYVSYPSGTTYITGRPENNGSYMSFKGCGTNIDRVDMRFSNFGTYGGGYAMGIAVYRTNV